MIAGLPWESWLLLLAAGGIGLALELAYWLRQRRGGPVRHEDRPAAHEPPVSLEEPRR